MNVYLCLHTIIHIYRVATHLENLEGEFQSGQGKWKKSGKLKCAWTLNELKSWSCSFWQLVGLDCGYVHAWHSCSFSKLVTMLVIINVKQRLLKRSLCSISIIFTCPSYWISQGISCSLESGHPEYMIRAWPCTLSLTAIFVFFDKKIINVLKITGTILVELYLWCTLASSKTPIKMSVWPWPLTLRDKINAGHNSILLLLSLLSTSSPLAATLRWQHSCVSVF